MANFFKEYHAERRAKETAQEKTVEYSVGQIVYINPMYDENRNGKRYFVERLSGGRVLLAKTKKDAMSGCGYIYGDCDVVRR